MATSKAKRPILLAQPKPQHKPRSTNPKTNPDPAAVMPVKAHVYRAIGEMNSGFEKVVQELHTLSQVSFLRPERVTAMRELVSRVRAQANRDFTMAMHERERGGAGVEPAARLAGDRRHRHVQPGMRCGRDPAGAGRAGAHDGRGAAAADT
jgi:hypothetical protein